MHAILLPSWCREVKRKRERETETGTDGEQVDLLSGVVGYRGGNVREEKE